ncbi:MAG: hypothetical protein KGH63_05010, partial [Candidatus Micrarchaeota archaeon]|nr:hypothetical protein [Candidatus Micrarchaeota archaeon]
KTAAPAVSAARKAPEAAPVRGTTHPQGWEQKKEETVAPAPAGAQAAKQYFTAPGPNETGERQTPSMGIVFGRGTVADSSRSAAIDTTLARSLRRAEVRDSTARAAKKGEKPKSVQLDLP